MQMAITFSCRQVATPKPTPGAFRPVGHRHEERFDKTATNTAPAYSVVQILVDAIQRADSLDPTAIRDAHYH